MWGCGRRFARIYEFGRHFRFEEGKICLKPLYDEEGTSKYEIKPRRFPTALLAQYPDLRDLDFGGRTHSNHVEVYRPDISSTTPAATVQTFFVDDLGELPTDIPEIVVAEGTPTAKDSNKSPMAYAKPGIMPKSRTTESSDSGLIRTMAFLTDQGYYTAAHTSHPSSLPGDGCSNDLCQSTDSSPTLILPVDTYSLPRESYSLPVLAYSTVIRPDPGVAYDAATDYDVGVPSLGMLAPQRQQPFRNQSSFSNRSEECAISSTDNFEPTTIPIGCAETFTPPCDTAGDSPGDGGLAVTIHKLDSEYSRIPNDDIVNGLRGLSLSRSFLDHTRLCSSISSAGEMSFVGSIDSDEATELWERELPSGLRAVRSKLVDQLLFTFKDTLVEDSTEQPLDCDNTSSSSQKTSATNSSSDRVATNSSATSLGKRVRGDRELNSDGLRSPDHKKKRTHASLISLDGRLLACPYNKMGPSRCSEVNIEEKNYRGCSSCYLTTISRLKQHLYRVHKRPDHYCVCCFSVFESRDLLDAHARKRPACEVQEPQFGEKMSVDQVTLIRRRAVGQDQSEIWFAAFEILFPGAARPLSAYADSVSPELVQQFVDHFNRQARGRLLELIRVQLEGIMTMDSEQQRILDSALEIALAQLVSATDLMQDRCEYQSSAASPEQSSSPPPLHAKSMDRHREAAVLEGQPPDILLTSPTLERTRLGQETFERQANQFGPPALQQNYLFQTSFDNQYSSSHLLMDYTNYSLPDLPKNAFFNNDL